MNSSARRAPNRRGEGNRLREDLLDAALGLVDAGLASELSLRAVARGAGVAAPSVYRHFSNLAELIGAVVTRCFEALIAEIELGGAGSGHPEDHLLGCCRGYLHYAERFPDRYALLFGRTGGGQGRPAGTRAEDSRGSSVEAFALLVDAVRACVANEGDGDDEDGGTHSPEQMAAVIWVGLDGYANLRVYRPAFPWPDPDTMLRLVVLDHLRSSER